MKRIIALTLCLGLASSLTLTAAPKDKAEKKERKAERKVAKSEAKLDRAQERSERQQLGLRGSRETAAEARFNRVVNAEISPVVAENRSGRNLNRQVQRRGPSNYSWSYNEARRYHNRGVRRDRNWYRSNYSRFAIFAGGQYYFDRGYWYPAYGYDPSYSTYRFDEPIYGYNSLEPGQVLVNVQRELRRQGYYRGAIDGLIGPMTRAALSRYQRDNGLYVTRAIDGPTLAALGLS